MATGCITTFFVYFGRFLSITCSDNCGLENYDVLPSEIWELNLDLDDVDCKSDLVLLRGFLNVELVFVEV